MEIKNWDVEKPRLFMALGKMEAWTATLLQSVQEAKQMIEKAENDFLFKPESHPVGVPEFEMAMRDIDSPLREILAVHQAIQHHYRENSLPLDSGKLIEKSDFTTEEIVQVLGLMHKSGAVAKADITPDKIVLRIEPNE